MKKRNLLMTTMAMLSTSGAFFAASSTALAATTHEIVQNDTLWSLSRKYGVSVKALKQANNLTSDLIIAGKTLKVPSKASAKLATATSHKVVKGDTLWSIAKKYGVSVASLKQANNLTSDVIRVGQKLRLYPAASNASQTAGANTSQTTGASRRAAGTNNANQQAASSAAASNASQAADANASRTTSASRQAAGTNNANQQAASSAAASNASQAADANASQTTSTSSQAAGTNTTNQTSSSASQAAVSQAPTSSASANSSASSITSYALSFIGVPYVWGGSTPAGFDCSGFVQYVYSHFGISLGRTTYAQEYAGSKISVAQAQPGDLYFWGSYGSAYHVAIALGGGQYIQAPAPGQSVSVSSVSYYAPSFAVRVL